MNIQGESVYLAKNSTILAPGAARPVANAVGFDGGALTAGVTVRAGAWYNPGSSSYAFVNTLDTQQIYLDQGAAIDVAGLSGVTASVAENIVSVELRGTELADSPLQRNGALRGQTIKVDVRQHGPWDPTLNGGLGGYTWVGTPLANTSGWVGLASHTVAELGVNGGSVSLRAGGAVILGSGSDVNVAGGSINYAGGYTQTTKLTGADGHIYDIAKATADHTYSGIYSGTTTTTDPKWGVTTTSTNPLAQGVNEPGYIQGGNGGSLAISAPVMALDGTLQGNTVSGSGQRTLSPLYNPAAPPVPGVPLVSGEPGWLLNAVNQSIPAQLALTFGRQYFSGGYTSISPTPANIVIGTGSTLVPADAYDASGDYLFPIERNYELDLAPSLVSSTGAGFGILRIDNSDDNLGASPGYGNITVKKGTAVVLPSGGALTLAAGNISIGSGATITAPGGAINLSAYDISPSVAGNAVSAKSDPVTAAETYAYHPDRGTVSVAAGASLSTAGALVDDRPTSATSATLPLITKGGTVAISASDIIVSAGSDLNVSGGAAISATNKWSYGDAGTISLVAGKALGSGFGTVAGGGLTVAGATMQGYAGVGQKGGSLTLQAPSVSVQNLTAGTLAVTDPLAGTLELAPKFFNNGGFTNFSVTGLGVAVGSDGTLSGAAPAFSLAPSTTVAPQVQNWDSLTGGTVYLAQAGVRQPASLNFRTAGVLNDVNDLALGNSTALTVGTGALIATDAGGGVTLAGGTLDVLGSVTAHGGNINLAAAHDNALLFYLPTIHLGAASLLDASGTTVYAQDLTGYHKSNVLDGGKITIAGNLVATKGASLNVAGSTDTIQLSPGQPTTGVAQGSAVVTVSMAKDSNSGTIALQADQMLLSAATLKGAAGGATATGGTVNVSSAVSNFNPASGTVQFESTDPTLTLTAAAPSFLYAGLGQQVTDLTGQPLGDSRGLGLVQFDAASFNNGGFGALALTTGKGAVQVQGNVALTASRQLSLADGGILSLVNLAGAPASAKPSLNLAAPYVVLGNPFSVSTPAVAQSNPFGQAVAAMNGSGVITVLASSLIDVGNLSLQNTGTVVLDATNGGRNSGTIRGDGTLDVAGAISLKAAQIYPPTAVTFNIVANDYTVNSVVKPGSVTIQSTGTTEPTLPLSAGGTLGVYASNINQAGVLRAPVGTINLGTGAGAGTDPLSGQALPVTSTLTLQPGSVTSVSALDPVTGKPATIPYGITVNGSAWIDPTGTDITNVGPSAKAIKLTAATIDLQPATSASTAATIDLSGGGDLLAYQYVPGTGGSTDVLLGSTAGAFAILPGYKDAYAPFAAFNTDTDAKVSLGSDPGYTIGNTKLNYIVGDSIHLEAGAGLPAGNYTLLPARYALLPGAYLVTPQSTRSTAGAAVSVVQPNGATVVSGYRYSGLDATGNSAAAFTSFELAPQSVVVTRAQYDSSAANSFFTGVATDAGTVAPRLPVDAGRLGLAAGQALNLAGTVTAGAATGGRGGLVDISSSADILIGSSSVVAAQKTAGATGTLLLDAAALSGFGADSLLIGGNRTSDSTGTTVTVTTGSIKVDNAGEALTGSDIILVANKSVAVAANADIEQTRVLSAPADKLLLKDSAQLGTTAGSNSLTLARGGVPVAFPGGLVAGSSLVPSAGGTITNLDGTTATFLANAPITALAAGSTITLNAGGSLTASFDLVSNPVPTPIAVTLGDGLALRVSSDTTASITRTGVASSTAPVFTVGAGAKLAGNRVIVDSTSATTLDATAAISGKSIALDSGQIGLQLDNTVAVQPTTGLVLAGTTLQTLQSGTQALSLLSYSSIDLYGSGSVGAVDAAGQPVLASLALHAGELRGFSAAGGGGDVTFAAKNILLDNAAGAVGPGAVASATGTLAFNAGNGTIELGANQLNVDQYSRLSLKAAGGLELQGTGGLATQNDLAVATAVISAETGANQTITAAGKVTVDANGTTPTIATDGLGAQLALTGATVAVNSNITLRSGALSLRASGGDLQVGDLAPSQLDASGTAQTFSDVTKYTDAGRITLAADTGSVIVAKNATVNLAAQAAGGTAGTLTVNAPNGTFGLADGVKLLGQGGTAGSAALMGRRAGRLPSMWVRSPAQPAWTQP